MSGFGFGALNEPFYVGVSTSQTADAIRVDLTLDVQVPEVERGAITRTVPAPLHIDIDLHPATRIAEVVQAPDAFELTLGLQAPMVERGGVTVAPDVLTVEVQLQAAQRVAERTFEADPFHLSLDLQPATRIAEVVQTPDPFHLSLDLQPATRIAEKVQTPDAFELTFEVHPVSVTQVITVDEPVTVFVIPSGAGFSAERFITVDEPIELALDLPAPSIYAPSVVEVDHLELSFQAHDADVDGYVRVEPEDVLVEIFVEDNHQVNQVIFPEPVDVELGVIEPDVVLGGVTRTPDALEVNFEVHGGVWRYAQTRQVDHLEVNFEVYQPFAYIVIPLRNFPFGAMHEPFYTGISVPQTVIVDPLALTFEVETGTPSLVTTVTPDVVEVTLDVQQPTVGGQRFIPVEVLDVQVDLHPVATFRETTQTPAPLSLTFEVHAPTVTDLRRTVEAEAVDVSIEPQAPEVSTSIVRVAEPLHLDITLHAATRATERVVESDPIHLTLEVQEADTEYQAILRPPALSLTFEVQPPLVRQVVFPDSVGATFEVVGNTFLRKRKTVHPDPAGLTLELHPPGVIRGPVEAQAAVARVTFGVPAPAVTGQHSVETSTPVEVTFEVQAARPVYDQWVTADQLDVVVAAHAAGVFLGGVVLTPDGASIVTQAHPVYLEGIATPRRVRLFFDLHPPTNRTFDPRKPGVDPITIVAGQEPEERERSWTWRQQDEAVARDDRERHSTPALQPEAVARDDRERHSTAVVQADAVARDDRERGWTPSQQDAAIPRDDRQRHSTPQQQPRPKPRDDRERHWTRRNV